MFMLAVAANDASDDLNGVDVEQGQGGLAWLKEIDMPRELKMCSVHYGGPPISDKWDRRPSPVPSLRLYCI